MPGLLPQQPTQTAAVWWSGRELPGPALPQQERLLVSLPSLGQGKGGSSPIGPLREKGKGTGGLISSVRNPAYTGLGAAVVSMALGHWEGKGTGAPGLISSVCNRAYTGQFYNPFYTAAPVQQL